MRLSCPVRSGDVPKVGTGRVSWPGLSSEILLVFIQIPLPARGLELRDLESSNIIIETMPLPRSHGDTADKEKGRRRDRGGGAIISLLRHPPVSLSPFLFVCGVSVANPCGQILMVPIRGVADIARLFEEMYA